MSAGEMDGSDLSLVNLDWSCEGCQALQQKLAKSQEDHLSNYTTLKQKIISTDLLIKKFKTKCDKYDSQNKRLEESTKQLEKSQRDCQTLEQQMKVALEQLEPLKKANATLAKDKGRQAQELSTLSDKLQAAEQLQKQYKQFTIESEQHKRECDQKTEANQKKLHNLEISSKKQEGVISKLKDDLSQKRSELADLKKRNKKLETEVTKVTNKANKYYSILLQNGLLPRGERPPGVQDRVTAPSQLVPEDQGEGQDESSPDMEEETAHGFVPDVLSDEEEESVTMEPINQPPMLNMADIFSDILRSELLAPISPLAPSPFDSDPASGESSAAESCEEEELSKFAGLLESEILPPQDEKSSAAPEDETVEDDTPATVEGEDVGTYNKFDMVTNNRAADEQKDGLINTYETSKLAKGASKKCFLEDKLGQLGKRLSPMNVRLPSLLEDEVLENSSETRGLPFPTDAESLSDSDTDDGCEEKDSEEAGRKVTRQGTTEFIVSKDCEIESVGGSSTDHDGLYFDANSRSPFTPEVPDHTAKLDLISCDVKSSSDKNTPTCRQDGAIIDVTMCQNNKVNNNNNKDELLLNNTEGNLQLQTNTDSDMNVPSEIVDSCGSNTKELNSVNAPNIPVTSKCVECSEPQQPEVRISQDSITDDKTDGKENDKTDDKTDGKTDDKDPKSPSPPHVNGIDKDLETETNFSKSDIRKMSAEFGLLPRKKRTRCSSDPAGISVHSLRSHSKVDDSSSHADDHPKSSDKPNDPFRSLLRSTSLTSMREAKKTGSSPGQKLQGNSAHRKCLRRSARLSGGQPVSDAEGNDQTEKTSHLGTEDSSQSDREPTIGKDHGNSHISMKAGVSPKRLTRSSAGAETDASKASDGELDRNGGKVKKAAIPSEQTPPRRVTRALTRQSSEGWFEDAADESSASNVMTSGKRSEYKVKDTETEPRDKEKDEDHFVYGTDASSIESAKNPNENEKEQEYENDGNGKTDQISTAKTEISRVEASDKNKREQKSESPEDEKTDEICMTKTDFEEGKTSHITGNSSHCEKSDQSDEIHSEEAGNVVPHLDAKPKGYAGHCVDEPHTEIQTATCASSLGEKDANPDKVVHSETQSSTLSTAPLTAADQNRNTGTALHDRSLETPMTDSGERAVATTAENKTLISEDTRANLCTSTRTDSKEGSVVLSNTINDNPEMDVPSASVNQSPSEEALDTPAMDTAPSLADGEVVISLDVLPNCASNEITCEGEPQRVTDTHCQGNTETQPQAATAASANSDAPGGSKMGNVKPTFGSQLDFGEPAVTLESTSDRSGDNAHNLHSSSASLVQESVVFPNQESRASTLPFNFVPIYIPTSSPASAVPSVIRQSTSSITVVSPETSGPIVGGSTVSSLSRSATPSSHSSCSISASSPVSPLPPSPFEYMNIIPISPLPPSPVPAEPLSPLPSSPSGELEQSDDTLVGDPLLSRPGTPQSIIQEHSPPGNLLAGLNPTPLPQAITPLPITPVEPINPLTPLSGTPTANAAENSASGSNVTPDGSLQPAPKPSTSRHPSGDTGASRRNLELSFSDRQIPQNSAADASKHASGKAVSSQKVLEEEGGVSVLRARKRISHFKHADDNTDGGFNMGTTPSAGEGKKRKSSSGSAPPKDNQTHPTHLQAAGDMSASCEGNKQKKKKTSNRRNDQRETTPVPCPGGDNNNTNNQGVPDAGANLRSKKRKSSGAENKDSAPKVVVLSNAPLSGAKHGPPVIPLGTPVSSNAGHKPETSRNTPPPAGHRPKVSSSDTPATALQKLQALPPDLVQLISHELEGYMRLSGADPNPVLQRILQGKPPQLVIQILIQQIHKTGASCTINKIVEQLPGTDVPVGQTDGPFISDQEGQVVRLLQGLLHSVREQHQMDVSHVLMESIWKQVFDMDTAGLNGVIIVRLKTNLCRLYAALCRLQGNLEQCRVFTYHVFRCHHLSFPTISLAMAAVWPELLRRSDNPSPILVVMEYLVMDALSSEKTKHDAMKKLLGRLCGWTPQSCSPLTVYSLLHSRLEEMVSALPPLDPTSVMELVKSYELILVRERWPKVMEVLTAVFPCVGDIVSKQQEALSHSLIPPILHMFGAVLCHFTPLVKQRPEVRQFIVQVIHYLLGVKLYSKVPLSIQEEAVVLLLKLSYYSPDDVAERLKIWYPKHRDKISPQLQTKLVSFINIYKPRWPSLRRLITTPEARV